MALSKQNRFRLLGGVFLGLALYQFLTGGAWVVWVILGVMFGGLGLFRGNREGSGE